MGILRLIWMMGSKGAWLTASRAAAASLAFLLVFAVSYSATAQERGNFPPVFELTNQDNATVFLFGTAHLLPKETPWLSEDVIQSLESSDLIVLETDITAAFLPEVQAYTLERGTYSDGQTLESELPEDLYSSFVQILEGQDIPPDRFSSFRPWFVAILSGAAFSTDHGIVPQLGVDQFLQNWVFARGDLSIAYLESPRKAIDILANLPREQELKLFEMAVVEPAKIASTFLELVSAWTTWNEDELYRLSFGAPDAVDLRRTLLDARNIVWVEQINEMTSEHQTIFVAVGAGHLVGDNNVIQLLTDQGWELQE